MPNTGRGELQDDSLFKPSAVMEVPNQGSPSLFGLSLQKASKHDPQMTLSAADDPTTYRTGGASTGRQTNLPQPSQHLYAGGSVQVP